MGTILIVILVLVLVGALLTWPHSKNWGYYPTESLMKWLKDNTPSLYPNSAYTDEELQFFESLDKKKKLSNEDEAFIEEHFNGGVYDVTQEADVSQQTVEVDRVVAKISTQPGSSEIKIKDLESGKYYLIQRTARGGLQMTGREST